MKYRNSLDLQDRIPFCGCGSSSQYSAWMLEYMLCVQADDKERDDFNDEHAGQTFALLPERPGFVRAQAWIKNHGDAGEMIAHICAHADLTEHGGTVWGAWMTDEGHWAVALWQERGTDDWAWEEISPGEYQVNRI